MGRNAVAQALDLIKPGVLQVPITCLLVSTDCSLSFDWKCKKALSEVSSCVR